jgi:enoyl-ACP reductase-like protein
MSQRQVRPVGSNDSVRGTAAYDRRSPRDPIEQHAKWASDIQETQGFAPNYPMIGDPDLSVSAPGRGYHVLHASSRFVVEAGHVGFEADARSRDVKRVGDPDEIAGLVAYLASGESGYMTGSSLTIDGGMVGRLQPIGSDIEVTNVTLPPGIETLL